MKKKAFLKLIVLGVLVMLFMSACGGIPKTLTASCWLKQSLPPEALLKKAEELTQYNDGFVREQALELYQRACDLGSTKGCFLAGVTAESLTEGFIYPGQHIGYSKGWQIAAEYFEKACNKGYTPGCFRAGVAYEKCADKIKALKLYQKACEEGNSFLGCYFLGCYFVGKLAYDKVYMENRKNQTIDQNYAKLAQKYLQKACNIGPEERKKEFKSDFTLTQVATFISC